MTSITHPHALHFDHPVHSYWEESATPLGLDLPALAGEASCDVAIIGAGFTGLSAALALARDHHLDVRVLDAAMPGWGASGRNGGFACIGSHKLSYTKMIAQFGLEDTRGFYNTLKNAVSLVRDTCEANRIDAWIHGEGEVTLAHLPNRAAEFAEERSFMAATFGEKLDLLSVEDLKQRGLFGPRFHGGLYNQTGFGVHPLNYVRGLARAASQAGSRIHAHSPVLHWQETPEGHILTTSKGRLKARQVIIATNGYTPEETLKPLAGRIMPALSNIIITRPLTAEEQQAQGWTSSTMAYDSRNLLHYFRLLPNGRFLFGGRGGTDASNAGADMMQAQLTQTFHQLFPAWAQAEITHFWRGYVCLSYDLVPYVGALNDRKTVWTAIAYHGNGVAMASYCGKALADMVAQKATREKLPAVLTRRLAKFPFPAFRPLYLKGAYVWYGINDAN